MVEITNNSVLNNYIKELDKDVKITEYNLKEQSLLASSNWAKWLSYLYHEKENLDKIEDTKQKILKKKNSSNNKNTDSILRLKSEDKILETDENLKKLRILAKQTQDNIDFIERALNILSNFGFSIKNATEIIKLSISH